MCKARIAWEGEVLENEQLEFLDSKPAQCKHRCQGVNINATHRAICKGETAKGSASTTQEKHSETTVDDAWHAQASPVTQV